MTEEAVFLRNSMKRRKTRWLYYIETALVVMSCAISMAIGAVKSVVKADSHHFTAATPAAMQNQINILQNEIQQLEEGRSIIVDEEDSKTNQRLSKLFAVQDDQKPYVKNSVVVAPYINKPTFYSGGQLVVNSPDIHEDAKLLLRRYLNDKAMAASGYPVPPSPRLVLSGLLEADAIVYKPYQGAHVSDFFLSGGELDSFVELTPWVNGILAMAYDGGTNETDTRRVSNSNMYLDKGFVTIGNFHKSPFYGSMGQMYVPFGRYQSNLIISTLPKYLGKTQARAINIGYVHKPKDNTLIPFINAYVFKGDSQYGNTNIAKQYGLDAELWYGNDDWDNEYGVSYIANMADAMGMQDNGVMDDDYFQGFDDSSDTEKIVHAVPAADAYVSLTYHQYNLLAEYVTALKQFSEQAMTFNSHGAKPSAFNIEGDYSFNILNIPSTFSASYGCALQSLAIGIPEESYALGVSSTFSEDVLLTLEVRHDVNYGKNNTATGAGKPAYVEDELGHSINAITSEIGIYF